MNQPYLVQNYMTACPHAIGVGEPLSSAHAVMRRHQIRHLPVLRDGELVGILTDRDLSMVEALPGVEAADVTVDEAMTQAPYTVLPEMPLEDVALEMGDKKYGCAVVLKRGQVVGIFTSTDACLALAALLRGRDALPA